jgi:hypothetical protein
MVEDLSGCFAEKCLVLVHLCVKFGVFLAAFLEAFSVYLGCIFAHHCTVIIYSVSHHVSQHLVVFSLPCGLVVWLETQMAAFLFV